MNQNYCKSCNTPRRRGLTLIEVIAATTLLATLLVAALTGFGRHREQLRRALAKQNAVAAMDQLMADWFGEAAFLSSSIKSITPLERNR